MPSRGLKGSQGVRGRGEKGCFKQRGTGAEPGGGQSTGWEPGPRVGRGGQSGLRRTQGVSFPCEGGEEQ